MNNHREDGAQCSELLLLGLEEELGNRWELSGQLLQRLAYHESHASKDDASTRAGAPALHTQHRQFGYSCYHAG